MPLDLCHPTAPHEKLKLPEWYVSSLMMDRALDAICRRVKKFDRKHDVPYLAGYSQKFVKRIGDERLSKVPRDLDTKPYRDEHDDDLLRRMLACTDKGQVPKGFRRQQLKDAASTIRQYLRRHAAQGTRRAEAIRGQARPKRRAT